MGSTFDLDILKRTIYLLSVVYIIINCNMGIQVYNINVLREGAELIDA